MKWPRNIPEDLRTRIDSTLGMRSVNAATLWGDVLEWLEKHEVKPPDHRLPESPEMSAQKDQ